MAEDDHGMSHSCSICLEEFKSPKVLSCGHTFCLPCVNKIVDREDTKPTLQCPLCKVNVAFPESGETEDLATNFQLLSVLKISKQNEGDEMEEEGVKGLSRCDLHRQENQLYCEICKIPVCTKCIFQEHKVGEHNVITKEDYIAAQTLQLADLKQRLNTVEEICDNISTELASHRSAYTEDKQRLEETIERILKEKQEKLAQSAKSLLDQVQESSNKPEDLYTSLTTQISLRQELIINLQTTAKNLNQDLESKKFTKESDLEEIDRYINGLTPELAGLRKACNAVPTKTSLNFHSASSNTHLGYLSPSGSVPQRIKSKTTAWFQEKGSQNSVSTRKDQSEA